MCESTCRYKCKGASNQAMSPIVEIGPKPFWVKGRGAKIREQRDNRDCPQFVCGYSPEYGYDSPNHDLCLSSLSVPKSWRHRGDSGLARLSKAYGSTARKSVTFGTVTAHRGACPRARVEEFRSGCHAPVGLPTKAGGIGIARTDWSNPRHHETSSAPAKAQGKQLAR